MRPPPRRKGLRRKDIFGIKGAGQHVSAHPTFPRTFSLRRLTVSQREPPGDEAPEVHSAFVVKQNKVVGGVAQVDASLLEVAFSAVFSLLMPYGLCPKAELVLEDTGDVFGIASRNFSEEVIRRVGRGENLCLLGMSLGETIMSFEAGQDWRLPQQALQRLILDKYETSEAAYNRIRSLKKEKREELLRNFDEQISARQKELNEVEKHNLLSFLGKKVGRHLAFKDTYKSLVKRKEQLIQDINRLKMDKALLVEIESLNYEEWVHRKQSRYAGKDLGYTFLKDMPAGFFTKLLQLHELDGSGIRIDMDSLAAVLTASYALEEDDLHKNNIGFFVREVDGNKVFTFFKIDHDLAFDDSIMSRRDQRLANLFYGKDAFAITELDLKNFPDLKDAKPHYWPTMTRLIAKGEKQYQDADTEGFKKLKDDPQFKRAKWKHFLKLLLLPEQMVIDAITEHLDAEDPMDLVKINQIKTAFLERRMTLRSTLMAIPAFKEFLLSADAKTAVEEIIRDVKQYHGGDCHTGYIDAINDEVTILRDYARSIGHEDTPLHVAILMGDYQFSHTQENFYEMLNIKNASCQNPFELALSVYSKLCQFKVPEDLNERVANEAITKNAQLRQYYALTILDLDRRKHYKFLSKDGNEELLKKLLNDALLGISDQNIYTYEDFKREIIKISTLSLPLATRKSLALTLLQVVELPKYALNKLKAELFEDPATTYAFIRERQSKYWFVRKLLDPIDSRMVRTTTSRLFKQMIDMKIADCRPGIELPTIKAQQ